MDLWLSVVAIFLLLILSAFFAACETAMTAVSKARMHGWEKEGNKRAAQVNAIREGKESMIGALLLGNNVVNILASALATSVLIEMFGDAGVLYATAVMTVLVLVFAEVLPKTYALHHADSLSVALVPVIKIVIWVFSPLSISINAIVRFTIGLFGGDLSKVSAGRHIEVLRGAIELHEGDDKEVQDQRAMLRSILDLEHVEVGEIMTHRSNVTMIDADDPLGAIIDAVLKSPYTRLPVYKGDTENIIGILHAKALIRELRARKDSVGRIDLTALVADPWFIPDSTSLYEQLQAFRERREHFALVVDEYGTFMGIVTLEDILEEIVGEIDDEHDIKVTGVQKQPGGTYLVEGTVTIRDLKREFEWTLPDQNYSTLAGLILHEAKCVPDSGQSFTFYGFRFDIMKREKNQLTLIRVTPPLAENI